MKSDKLLFVFMICGTVVLAQRIPAGVRISTTPLGSSAISVNTIVATTFQLPFPASAYGLDPVSSSFIVSGYEKKSGAGLVAAFSGESDSLRWSAPVLCESLLFNSKSVLCAVQGRSTEALSTEDGARQMDLKGSMVCGFPGKKIGLFYSETSSDELTAIDLASGDVHWKATVPKAEGWLDLVSLGDSVIIAAGSGLYAIHATRGLIWSFPVPTSDKKQHQLKSATFSQGTLDSIGHLCLQSTVQDVTGLASNILNANGNCYFAGRDKLIAVSSQGKLQWQTDLSANGASRMQLFVSDGVLFLVSTGVARHNSAYTAYGKPFVMLVSASDGRIIKNISDQDLESLLDYSWSGKTLIVAGREAISEINASGELKTLSLVDPSYGNLVQLIDGEKYYSMREGYFKPLNKLGRFLYYKSDNNKVYAIEKNNIRYEYNFPDLYRFDKKYDGKTILGRSDRTIVTDNNYELLFAFKTGAKNIIGKSRMYFISNQTVHAVRLADLR